MMKKNGFTLAEVLITLAIIGVVATLTLPALLTNTGEQQYVTGLKKGINTLTEAAQMNEAMAGFNYGSLSEKSGTLTESGAMEKQSLFGLLANRAAVDFGKTGSGSNGVNNSSANYAVFFRDGSALYFNKEALSDDTPYGAGGVKANHIEDDNLPYGIPVIYDVNGTKGPNLVSNCVPNSKLLASEDINDKGEASDCSKDKRIIRDQFGIRLRGSYVVPNGKAAKWAMGQ